MFRHRADPASDLLDSEAWEAPFQLSDDDLCFEIGADRRAIGHAAQDREDER
ncbi:MAG: hypothetical protein K0M78_06375 [Brevundimonas sp.]|nr:hypothetical protein [Brevundimonas sp.]